jgi:hypothetical protein
MGYKSRSNWLVSECFRKCGNRGSMCEECIGSRLFIPQKPSGIYDKEKLDVSGVAVRSDDSGAEEASG